MSSSSTYIHGINPAERERLTILNDLLNHRCLEKIQVNVNDRILDVGSGLGLMTFAFSKSSGPNGYCLGIERSESQLQNSSIPKSDGLSFRQGDALNLPLHSNEVGSFDLVHARFILEHLPTPSKAIQEMYRALRPGGRIVLADDDHQAMILFPEPDGFQQLWTAYMDSFLEIGNDPFIGRKLPQLLKTNGFIEVRNDFVFFGDVFGSPTFPIFSRNLIEVIATAKDVMFSENLITPSDFEAAIAGLKCWSENEQATAWYPLCIAFGIKPFEL